VGETLRLKHFTVQEYSMIKLGSTVQDKFTGIRGIATARVEYISGNPRVQVEAPPSTDGKPTDPQWFDEDRLEVRTTEPSQA
jgi:hypothetical protein